jgi:two-component system sensor histidine kinase VanS
MKRSLKKRIAFMFIAIIVVTLLAIGFFHYALLERFYTDNKQKILIESYERINASRSSEDVEAFMTYCSQNGLVFALADEMLRFAGTNSQDGEDMVNRLFGSVMNMEKDSTKIRYKTADYQVIYFTDDVEYLQLFGQLDNGYYYVVRYPIDTIKDAVYISLQFYIMIGCVMLAASVVIIWKITSKLTGPVEELSALSKRMAGLDFEAEYTSGGEDEIGQLGANFNTMSKNLERAISELKSANIQLEKDIKKKEEIDEMRQEFISNVSHDLKTPITLIQGYAEGLKEMSQDAESRDFYCGVIIDEAQRMNRLVRQLLSLSQLESGQNRLDMERFNLAELIKGVVNASDIIIKEKGATVMTDCPDDLYVWGDELMIEEVITNYFSNALNHLSGEKKIHISCVEKDGTVTVTVFNTGEPIPEDELDKIWDKFYKVDKARTRQYGGSGIGLSIVKAIMDQHMQKCWAENYQNGVAFKFTLSSR